MHSNNIAVTKFIKSHVRKWSRALPTKENRAVVRAPVITLCMEPGSQGCQVAQTVADQLGFDLYNRDIIKAIAKSMKTGTDRIDMLEKERLSGMEDFVACLIEEKYTELAVRVLHNAFGLDHDQEEEQE